MLNPNLIYLNFGGKWVSKPEYLIQINRFKFQNIPSGSFATCSIKDKNGNKGIALLSHKTVKKINNKTLLSKYSSGFSPEAEQKASEILKRYIQRFKTYSGNISQHRAIFLNSICSDSGVCIAFGKQAKRISKHFNGFVNFEYVISVDQIGPTTINGFVKEITYEHFGYKANAILKSSNKKDSDNLLFEYLVGQYINKQCMVFPCFIETYGWYQYNTSTVRKNMKFNKVLDKNALKSSLEIGQIALQNYIDLIEDNICFENKQHWQTAERECTEIESLLKLACAKSKYLAQSAIGLTAAIFIYKTAIFPAETQFIIPFFKDFMLDMGWMYVVLTYFVIVGTSNAVNLTDGLDGLAIMPTVMVAGGLGIFAYLSGHVTFSDYLAIPYLPNAGELIVFCAALVGAGLGFLWFNAYPAMVFMGDVGALALGAALGVLAVLVRQEIVLMIMGGVFVMETVSVMIQVASFKLTGKRVFRMAPIHHHFELKGWPEPRVIVRFWIITVILVLIGLATLKLR